MLRLLYLIALAFLLGLQGCAAGIPDYYPPPPKPKPCHVVVKVDNGKWHCYERGEVQRKVLCPLSGGENCQ